MAGFSTWTIMLGTACEQPPASSSSSLCYRGRPCSATRGMSHCNLLYRSSEIKRNPPLQQLFLQNISCNIKKVFMVGENDILEITYCSFKQIGSSMTKLWGKVWPLYHFTQTQGKFPMHGCILNKQVRLLFIACGSGWTLKTSLHHMFIADAVVNKTHTYIHRSYIALEGNNVGAKLCLTTLTWMIGFGWNYNSLSLRYHSF